MSRKPLFLALAAAMLVAGIASAQDKGAKLYRWVDKQGKVHYDQALPPEAVDQARREFSAKTGTAVGSVDRALTPEERAQLEAEAKAAAEAVIAANEQKRLEGIMMASYLTEQDLRRAYGERISLLTMTIESTDISIKSLRENLATLLQQASDTELDNRRVLDDRVQTLRELHSEKVKQQNLQATRRADLAALNAEFARMLARYRELRGAATAPAAAATPPPAPGA
ncbi:MAG: hypothetical protein A3E01_16385 [Gammaproteobacteria bacterium RIFCSPHIGHO2_12_FULL_63_22]|nr:MAG: hypothetical protein A3E01_16385 [Gammaproteobacteria bacterium RIFCSPHIGHO2_12_FULL_63_22]